MSWITLGVSHPQLVDAAHTSDVAQTPHPWADPLFGGMAEARTAVPGQAGLVPLPAICSSDSPQPAVASVHLVTLDSFHSFHVGLLIYPQTLSASPVSHSKALTARCPERLFSSICSELAPCWQHWMPLLLALEDQLTLTTQRCCRPLSHLPLPVSFPQHQNNTKLLHFTLLILLGEVSGQESCIHVHLCSIHICLW